MDPFNGQRMRSYISSLTTHERQFGRSKRMQEMKKDKQNTEILNRVSCEITHYMRNCEQQLTTNIKM